MIEGAAIDAQRAGSAAKTPPPGTAAGAWLVRQQITTPRGAARALAARLAFGIRHPVTVASHIADMQVVIDRIIYGGRDLPTLVEESGDTSSGTSMDVVPLAGPRSFPRVLHH
jgi:hypothetical protein